MFDSNVLEVAIGLVFVYLLCSLICSAIKEWISRLFNMRSNDLEARISYLLDNKALSKNLIGHPLIQTTTRRTLLDKMLKRPGKPSNINPRIFATVLTDLLIKSSGTADIKMGKDNSIYKRKMLLDLERGIDKYEIKAGPVLKAMLQTAKMETGRIEEIMANVREQFSQWFDGAMEQLSKWYKQKTRLILFVIALTICFIFNIDTIMIAKKLHQGEGLQEVVSAAGTIAGTEITNPADIEEKEELKRIVRERLDQLLDLDLIGWEFGHTTAVDLRGLPAGFLEWIYKLIGIFITALAVAMGAPFWFSLLQGMIKIRNLKNPRTERV
ncbi:MAG: hypothetical protein GY950_07765 [bacterium]|nr:hypothetical protein [bacterium]